MASYSRNSVTKLLIVPLEGGGSPVEAYFNPKEIQVDKTVPWQKHKDSKADEPYLEFTGAEGRTLSMELLFDSFEDGGATVDGPLEALTTMAKMKQQDGPEEERRPPLLAVRNGPFSGDFKCVMESLSIKITMFNKGNQPVRATANVKFKEASKAFGKSGGGGGAGGGGGGAA
jgi:hypothetical protein